MASRRYRHRHQGTMFIAYVFAAIVGGFWPQALPVSPAARGQLTGLWLLTLAAAGIGWLIWRRRRGTR